MLWCHGCQAPPWGDVELAGDDSDDKWGGFGFGRHAAWYGGTPSASTAAASRSTTSAASPGGGRRPELSGRELNGRPGELIAWDPQAGRAVVSVVRT